MGRSLALEGRRDRDGVGHGWGGLRLVRDLLLKGRIAGVRERRRLCVRGIAEKIQGGGESTGER